MNKAWSVIELFHEGTRYLSNEEYQTAILYFEKALLFETENLETLRMIYQNLGKAYFHLDDLEKAYEFQRNDCYLSRRLNDENSEICSRDNLIYTLKKMGRFDDAISCCEMYIKLSEKSQNQSVIARAYYGMGSIYHMKAKKEINLPPVGLNGDHKIIENLKICLEYYRKNLEIVESLNDDVERGRTCGMVGNAFYLLEDGKQAQPYYLKRLAIGKQYGDKPAVLRSYINLGHNSILLRSYDAAISYYLQALALSRQLSDLTSEGQTCYSIGSTYSLLKNHREAVDHYLRHKEIAIELEDKFGLCCSLEQLSKEYLLLDERSLAEQHSRHQLQIATEIGNEEMVMKVQSVLVDVIGVEVMSDNPQSHKVLAKVVT